MSYGNLRAEMARKRVTIEMLSKLLDKHRETISYKLNKGRFYADEALIIQDKFFPEQDARYLFKLDDED